MQILAPFFQVKQRWAQFLPGFSGLWPVMETRDPRTVFWSLGLEGLVSVSKDFGLGLELFVSRLCMGYFLWSFARRSSFKKRF